MPLTTNDLKQIRTVVREEVDESVETLAVMVKKEFDRNDNIHQKMIEDNATAHQQMIDDNDKAHRQIRNDISGLEFIATEMVRRDELVVVKERLAKLEATLVKK